jgi:hypothetical protein
MNSKQVLTGAYLIFILIVLNSCSDSGDEADPCINGPQISIDKNISSVIGKSSGEIIVSASGGTGPYRYSIDGVNFQSSGSFSGLASGDYTVVVNDANICNSSKMATVTEVPEVFYANEIRPIIDTNCQVSGCHGGNSSIPTWATYNDVKAGASLIKARTSAKTMPPSGSLSDSNIKLIADWVDQGAPNN